MDNADGNDSGLDETPPASPPKVKKPNLTDEKRNQILLDLGRCAGMAWVLHHGAIARVTDKHNMSWQTVQRVPANRVE